MWGHYYFAVPIDRAVLMHLMFVMYVCAVASVVGVLSMSMCLSWTTMMTVFALLLLGVVLHLYLNCVKPFSEHTQTYFVAVALLLCSLVIAAVFYVVGSKQIIKLDMLFVSLSTCIIELCDDHC
jgi:hypothetical protein